ncbi:MAG: nitroreductase/quinone reductase family protein [Acidimicrobiia bacterium]
MNDEIEQALVRGGIVDITTTGRKSGQARRIEIYLHNFDGGLYLTGRPGFPRDWVANLRANPHMTLHLKRGVVADLPATAEVITDPEEKGRIILRARVEHWGADPDAARADLDHWIATSPAVRFSLDQQW